MIKYIQTNQPLWNQSSRCHSSTSISSFLDRVQNPDDFKNSEKDRIQSMSDLDIG